MQMRQKTATLGVEEDGGGFGKLAHPIASSVGAHPWPSISRGVSSAEVLW